MGKVPLQTGLRKGLRRVRRLIQEVPLWKRHPWNSDGSLPEPSTIPLILGALGPEAGPSRAWSSQPLQDVTPPGPRPKRVPCSKENALP